MFEHRPVDAEVRAALTDIDFSNYHDLDAKGLAAVTQFCGRGFTAADLARIEDANVAYVITKR